MNKVQIRITENGKLKEYDEVEMTDESVELLWDSVDTILVNQIMEEEE